MRGTAQDAYAVPADFVPSGTIAHCLQSLEEMRQSPNRQIQAILTRRCTEALKVVRSVASAFRAAPPKSKTDPVTPSHFVPSILRPLKGYFKHGGYGESLKDEFGQIWSRAVLQDVVIKWASLASRYHPVLNPCF